ncbi:MAG: cobalt ECF transporter T component CbiQ [Actinomycetota bacterium]
MPGDGRVHRAAPQCKVLATFLFAVAVAATPARTVWPFAGYLCLLAAVAAAGAIPPAFVARRLVFEVPFVACALVLPLTAGGPDLELGPLALSREGLWGAWNVVAKATLGLIATLLLAATTSVSDILRGLEALRVPRAFTSVASFLFRYAGVVSDDARRMRLARRSRAYEPRWLWQARGLAPATGALFVRSFERGERVHVAMLARGFDGSVPRRAGAAAPSQWVLALLVPAAAAAIAGLAWT